MGNVVTYDPREVILVVAIPPVPIKVDDFAPGSAIEIEFNEPLFREVPDCNGLDTRVQRTRFSGKLRFETVYGSKQTIALQAAVSGDILLGIGVGGWGLVDRNNGVTSLAGGSFAYISDNPPLTLSEEATATRWQINSRRIVIAHGGAIT